MGELRKVQSDLLLLDGGNAFFPQPAIGVPVSEAQKERAKLLARAMAHMQVGAVNVGTQDLAAGLEFLAGTLGRREGESLPFVSANLEKKDTHEHPFPASRVVQVGALKVGIFGLINPAEISDPALTAADLQETARKTAADLRGRCDLVVCLLDADFTTASRLAEQVQGLDIIVASHRTSIPRPQPMAIKNSLVVQAGNRGMYLGRLDLTVTGQVQSGMSADQQMELETELQRLAAQKAILQGRIQNDPEIQQEFTKVAGREEKLRKKLAAVRLPLTYQASLVSMDQELPEDPVVVKWLERIGIKPKPPAPIAPPSPPATPAGGK